MTAKKVALACFGLWATELFCSRKPKTNRTINLKKFCKHCGRVTVHQETK
ncbi:50S ribosomal protein L33 [Lacticaseibacillus paracasei subsp. paracasei Lpp126]|uniref:Large ribosomal subunit protein bL33 n=1 Tax=Lacticaseibacillus paracasei subsp. paracasei Lpp126 TaxID=1256206 RepID=S2RMD9_LACPA|nr:50S ribosomal protein L33 [Lacticaseibacillus paracasei subsp. paracasei Lpp126]